MKRILVTGANKGIGLATASKLLKDYDDTFVFLGSRDSERGHQAVSSLVENNNDWAGRLVSLELDVECDDSVTEASRKVGSMFDDDSHPIYGIINNAGVGGASLGIKRTLEVNTWGVRRVCDAFIPLLKPDGGRIVNVTSAAGPNYIETVDEDSKWLLTSSNVTWEEIEGYMNDRINEGSESAPGHFPIGNSYGLSKACSNALTLHLARENPGLIINACTPGFIETDLTKPLAEAQGNSPSEMGMKTPEEGASPSVFLIMEEVPGNGMYFGSDCVRSPLDRYRSPGDPPYTGD